MIDTFFLKKLTKYKYSSFIKSFAGRNNSGSIVVRHRSMLKKKKIIFLNLNRIFYGHISLLFKIFFSFRNKKIFSFLKFFNGAISFVPYIYGTFAGDYIISSYYYIKFKKTSYLGSHILLSFCDQHMIISNLNLKKKKPSLATSFGTRIKVTLVVEDSILIRIKLPSKLEKYISAQQGTAFIGRNGFRSHKFNILGKAGYSRELGFRPTVRGVAMNPVDHPHGGRTKVNKPEVSPWGWVAKKNK